MSVVEPPTTNKYEHKYTLLQTHVFMVFVSRSSPNCLPLKYKCPIKVSNWIRHAYLESALVGTNIPHHMQAKSCESQPHKFNACLSQHWLCIYSTRESKSWRMKSCLEVQITNDSCGWLSLLNLGVKVSLLNLEVGWLASHIDDVYMVWVPIG